MYNHIKKRLRLPPNHVSGSQNIKNKGQIWTVWGFKLCFTSPATEELVSCWLSSLFPAALPRGNQGPQTNTTLTFSSDSVLTVGNYKIAPRALNQMSDVVLWWDYINIRWCMVRCRACWPQQHPQMWHEFWSTLSHRQRTCSWIDDSLSKWNLHTGKNKSILPYHCNVLWSSFE